MVRRLLALAVCLAGCDATDVEPPPTEPEPPPPQEDMFTPPDMDPQPDEGVERAAVGDPCATREDCESNLCVPHPGGGGVCTQGCLEGEDDGCPDGWVCEDTFEYGPVCIPPVPRGLCAPCETNADCGGLDDLCLPLLGDGGRLVCARDCRDRGTPCPEGFSCEQINDFFQCVPDDGLCPEGEDRDGDGTGDAIDNCPDTPNDDQGDLDGDGVGDVCDNCPNEPNPTQSNADGDDLGDACDPDYFPDDEGLRVVYGHFGGAASVSRSNSFIIRGAMSSSEPGAMMSSPGYGICSFSGAAP